MTATTRGETWQVRWFTSRFRRATPRRRASSGAASSAGSSRSIPGSPTEYHMTRFSDTQGGAIMGADGDKRGAARLLRRRRHQRRERARRRARRHVGRGDARADAWAGSSICKDTEGNEFGLWQNDPNAPGALEPSARGGVTARPALRPSARTHVTPTRKGRACPSTSAAGTSRASDTSSSARTAGS